MERSIDVNPINTSWRYFLKMPAIERTAYPRLRQRYFRQQDLQLYRPSQEEINWMKQHVSNDLRLQLSFLVQLKTFQRLGYFVTVNTVSSTIVEEIQKSLNIDECIKPHYCHKATLKRHRTLIGLALRSLRYEAKEVLVFY